MIKPLLDNIKKVVSVKEETLNIIIASFLTGHHVLLEDNPGTGKTTLAKAIAKSTNLDFGRIQLTPDLLPSDITGISIYNPKIQEFVLYKGPIFSQIILADEINRASPKTQSAMLEAMAERQVTLEGKTEQLDELFFVIATQNSIDLKGTFPLPEAQMDRFAVQLSLGYLSHDDEVAMLTAQEKNQHPLDQISPVISANDIRNIKKQISEVIIKEEVKNYLVSIVQNTRNDSRITIGAGPRATLCLAKLSQAFAFIYGDKFVTPDIIKKLAIPVLCHRIIVESSNKYSGTTQEIIIQDILKNTPIR